MLAFRRNLQKCNSDFVFHKLHSTDIVVSSNKLFLAPASLMVYEYT